MSISVDETTDTTTEEKTSQYPMYKVIMHNDDKTTMEFVMRVLKEFFDKRGHDAMKLMLEIHETGAGLAGVYMLEHAELKVDQTHSVARAAGFPLACSIESA